VSLFDATNLHIELLPAQNCYGCKASTVPVPCEGSPQAFGRAALHHVMMQ